MCWTLLVFSKPSTAEQLTDLCRGCLPRAGKQIHRGQIEDFALFAVLSLLPATLFSFDSTGESNYRNGNDVQSADGRPDQQADSNRRWVGCYAILTIALFAPLLASFVLIRNLYPFAASTMMMAAGNSRGDQTYYILRGETLTGAIIDLPAVDLTNALSNVAFGLVSATVENRSFSIRSPHPANISLLTALGGEKNLAPGMRLPDLLRSWGNIYNSRLPASSSQRLRAIRIDAYRRESGTYSKYDTYVKTWRVEL